MLPFHGATPVTTADIDTSTEKMTHMSDFFNKAWDVVKMPVGDKMYRAHTETRSFDWDAFGDTPEHALSTIANMWRNWMATNPDVTMTFEDFMEDVSVDEVVSGQGRMDREPYSSQTYDKDYLQYGSGDPEEMRMKLKEIDFDDLMRVARDPNNEIDDRYLTPEGLDEVHIDEIKDIFDQLPKDMTRDPPRGSKAGFDPMGDPFRMRRDE